MEISRVDRLTFVIISRWIILRMRNISDKFRHKLKTRILCYVTVLLNSCQLWDIVEKCCRAGQWTVDNIIWLMHIACCMPKSKSAQLRMCNNFSFPLQQWLHELASIWGFTGIACLVILFFYHCQDHPKRPVPVFPFRTLYAFLFVLSTCPAISSCFIWRTS